MTKLVRSTPRAEGIDPKAIIKLFRHYDEHRTGVQSMMILRHDKVVAEAFWHPYRPDLTHMLFSLSKSFTSVAIGFAVQEGLLSIEDKLLPYFADVLPEGAEPSFYMTELTIRDTLRMATGHVVEPSMQEEGKEKWVYQFLTTYVEKKPGTHYLYNTSATYMLSALIQKLTGQTVEEYLEPRLFEPLGFGEHLWEKSPEGISVGGSGFNLCTEDIAKFGIFLRNRGSYGGKQLLDPNWIDEATAKQIDFVNHMNIDSRQGYGYQFWRCQPKNAYRGAGAFAQFCIVLPDQEMVIAATSGAQDTQPVLTALWEILLPAVGKEEPQPDDEAATEELRALSASLKMPVAEGTRTAEGVRFWEKEYLVSKNPLGIERVSFAAKEENEVTLVIDGKPSTLTLGYGVWNDGTLNVKSALAPHAFRNLVPIDDTVAACGAWVDENTFDLRLFYNRTPFDDVLTFTFDEYGFTLRHVRKTGFRLVDDVYFGRPATTPVETSKDVSIPKKEFRF